MLLKIESIEAPCFSSDIIKFCLNHDLESSLDGLVKQYNSKLCDLQRQSLDLLRKSITMRPAASWMTRTSLQLKKVHIIIVIFGEVYGCTTY